MRYIGGGVGHQDITDSIQVCDELEEADEWEVDVEPQDVCSKVEDGDCEEDSDGEDSDVSNEDDVEDCDPDDDDIGSDIDNEKYDKL